MKQSLAGKVAIVTGAGGEGRVLDHHRVALDLDGLGAVRRVGRLGDVGIGDRNRRRRGDHTGFA